LSIMSREASDLVDHVCDAEASLSDRTKRNATSSTETHRGSSIESRRYFMMLGPPPQRKASTGSRHTCLTSGPGAPSAPSQSPSALRFCLHGNKRRRSGQGHNTGLARAEHAEHAEHAAGREQPWRRKTGKVGRVAGGGGTHWPSMSASSLRIRTSKSLTAHMSSPVGRRDAAPTGAAPDMPTETIISALFLGIPSWGPCGGACGGGGEEKPSSL
jgi:hypothetical protein